MQPVRNSPGDVVAGHGVIADVTETLVGVLDDALSSLFPAPAPQALVHDLQGTVPTNPPTLAVFLFEVSEDAHARNRPLVRRPQPGGVVQSLPPLALILRYLIVPYAGDRETEQRMLGRTLQVLYEDALLSGPQLRGDPAPAGLLGSADSLAATLDPLSLEERTRVWHAVQQPYRLSASYQVRVANLHPTIEEQVELARSRNFDPAFPVDA
jgi:hypothetical protein